MTARKQLLEQIHTTHYGGVHRNTQIIVVTMEIYLVREIESLTWTGKLLIMTII